MQAQECDGTWMKPEYFESEKLKEKLLQKRLRKIVVFKSEDEDGKPTKEARQAWRRYERTKRRNG